MDTIIRIVCWIIGHRPVNETVLFNGQPYDTIICSRCRRLRSNLDDRR